jgi:hypothetical protein
MHIHVLWGLFNEWCAAWRAESRVQRLGHAMHAREKHKGKENQDDLLASVKQPRPGLSLMQQVHSYNSHSNHTL